jgi:hypothetical protein
MQLETFTNVRFVGTGIIRKLSIFKYKVVILPPRSVDPALNHGPAHGNVISKHVTITVAEYSHLKMCLFSCLFVVYSAVLSVDRAVDRLMAR